MPLDSAYEPHTVFILESRYPVKTKEAGRPDVPEHIVNVIREGQFLPYVKHTNSTKATGGARLSMDAGWWPFLQRRVKKQEPEVWWKQGEDPHKLRLEALGFTDSEAPPESLREFYPDLNQYRNNGTKIVEATPTKTIAPHHKAKTIGEIRALYEPLLANEPFWRPLVSVTVATRPLALTLVRLCRALPRGLPFYASIDTHDRKTFYSFPDRMRLLRLQRIRQLTIDMARRLEGYYGGFIGIRFNKNDRGRAIHGERLGEPLPDSLRVIRVGIAHWYAFEKEMELWKLGAIDAGVSIDLKPMDDWGRKLDESGQVMVGQEVMEDIDFSDYGSEEGEEDDFQDEEGNDEIESQEAEKEEHKKDATKGGDEKVSWAVRPATKKVSGIGI
jgi:hypothetical protein